mgnify:CR=1 FL=1
MFNYRKKSRTKWNEVRRKAPKVPDITCPNIDEVIKIVETHYENKKVLTKVKFKKLERILERLRTANEKLRDSGIYWHDVSKELCKKYID